MNALQTLLIRISLIAGCAFAVNSPAAPPSDEASIREVMAATWDRPEARLDVSPVVVEGTYAIAGWTQGDRGGRAFLHRSQQGTWQVAACAGDGLKDAKTLVESGVPAPKAQRLSAALAQAESSLSKERLAKFSSFDGLLRMDAAGHHAPPASHPAH